MSHAAIDIQKMSYRYPNGFTALENINIQIPKNDFVAIIGQNGAGKSTLLKNIVGLYHPSKGSIVVDGHDTSKIAIAQLATKVGFVLQNPDRQLFESSVEAEIAFGPKNLGLSAAEVAQRVDYALEQTGLGDYRELFPMALSAGERAKVAIASVVAMQPSVIILDEPTTGQDRKGCFQIMDLAKRFHHDGRTVVVVTHHMTLVAEYAKRTIALCKGSVLLDGTTEEVFKQTELLKQTFIMPPQVAQLASAINKSLNSEGSILHTDILAEKMAMAIISRGQKHA